MIGKVVGSYKIVEKIGEGGMGAVYRAVDVMLEREAAIKAIRPDLAREPQIVERFRAEARTLARLHHPAIAMIYSFFHEGGDLYLAMEFVQGRPLSEVLRDEGRLPWERAVPLFASALDGIEQAHRIGVIHRDLKPDNLMLTPAGTLKVMDFGIARVVGSSHLTRTGLLVGTLRYMAPEQIRGEEVGRSTDIYSLGIVLYEMVTGRTPFQGASDYAILRAQIEDLPTPPSLAVPGLPGWIDEVILKALAKEPAARFQSVAELHAALARHAALSTLPSPLVAGFAAPAVAIPTPPPVGQPTAQPVSQATRPDRRAGGADQQPTMATGPKSLPTGSAAIPVSPPPTGAGSYRPMGGPGKGKHLLVTAAVVLFIALAGAGTVLWVQGRHSVEPTAVAALPGPASPTPDTATELAPSPSPAPAMSPAAGEPQPTSVPPPAQTRPSPRPQPPPPLETRPTPTPAPETEGQEQTPVEPAPREEPETSNGAAGDPEMLPLEEIRSIAGELKTESARLYALYEAFLEGKEDGGAELTAADEQLLEELEHFEDAAAGLNKQLKEGGFLGRARGRRPSDRLELVRRVRTLAERGQRVDALMAQVQPGTEVEQAWQGVRRRWQRAGALAGGAGGG